MPRSKQLSITPCEFWIAIAVLAACAILCGLGRISGTNFMELVFALLAVFFGYRYGRMKGMRSAGVGKR